MRATKYAYFLAIFAP
ncbi:uncharacterized protein FFB14_15853 [Fusarium fujikuroi]|nr:uncharacterized protein FFB14_15853 [Fusarium fujikuroi]